VTQSVKTPVSLDQNAPWNLRSVVGLIILGVGYLLLARASLFFIYPSEGIASIWPVSGLALAALLGSPRRRWPGVVLTLFIANLCANLLGSNPLPVSLGFTIVNCAECVLIGVLVTRLSGSSFHLQRLTDVLLFFGLGMVVSSLTAAIGALLAMSAFGVDFWHTWLAWWIADALGIALITPLLLAWVPAWGSKREDIAPRPLKTLEALILFGLMLAGCWYLFLLDQNIVALSWVRAYLLFPVLIWSGLRFNQRFVTFMLIFTGALAIGGTLAGQGQFADPVQPPEERLVTIQLYLSVLVFTALIPSAIVWELRQVTARLSQSESEYRNLFENAAVGIFHSVPGGGFLKVNPTLAAMLGYDSPEEMIAVVTDISSQVYVESLNYETILQEALQKNGWTYALNRYRRKDGSALIGRLSVRKVPRSDGSIAYLEGFVEDVSERINAGTALAESAQEFKSIVYSSPTAMHLYRLNLDGSLVLVDTNPMADRMLQTPAQTILG